MSQSNAAASYERERRLMMLAIVKGSLSVACGSPKAAAALRLRCYQARVQDRRQNKRMEAGEISTFDSLVFRLAGGDLLIQPSMDLHLEGQITVIATGEKL